ncbi:MAG: 3-deoxy-8-phosphooctulonate synthase [Acidobacteriota bacterium]
MASSESVGLPDLWSKNGRAPFFVIAGPCVIESEAHCLEVGGRMAEWCRRLEIPYVFKASFDKANRTSIHSYRGPGLEEGLAVLGRVREVLGVPVTSDIHEAWQAEPAAAVLDVIQIPALLCRQTDLVVAAARTGKPVNLKKGQFLAPWDMQHALEKAVSAGNDRLLVTERGTCFGYQNLVVDMRSLPVLRELGFPVVFDATHSVQIPGGGEARSSGEPRFIRPLARAAVAAGADGVFLEVHDAPERALSDGANSLPLSEAAGLLEELRELHALVERWDEGK